VPLDLFASARATAVVALVTASFTSPILVKSDAFASASARITGKAAAHEVPSEQLVAGGVSVAMPQDWGRLGSSAAEDEAAGQHIGTVVSGLCPGGSEGATCADGVQLTFLAYSGRDGHELPKLGDFQAQLDAKLAKQFRGFKKGPVDERSGSDATRYLDYGFSYSVGGKQRSQRFAAYRHGDGSGVVAIASGEELANHAKSIDRFLASASETREA
jgi:hypothetical protein